MTILPYVKPMVRHLVYLNSGNLNIRITPEIHSRIAMMAMQAGTTINGFIRDTLANVTGVTPATNA